jgi:hypothetical protein
MISEGLGLQQDINIFEDPKKQKFPNPTSSQP